MSSILSDRPIISTVTTLMNRRISNVETLSKTVIDNIHTNMSTRIDAIQSIATRTPSTSGLGLLQGLKTQLAGFLNRQMEYPQYVSDQVQVPGQPVVEGVPVTYAGTGQSTAVTVVQPAPTIVSLPVQSI